LTALIFSILCSTFLVLLFKAFSLYNVNSFNAIVINYGICVLCGIALDGGFDLMAVAEKPWLYVAIVLGTLFISGFFAMAKTVQHYGVTVGSVTSKMSIAISVSVAIILFNENASWLKVLGIAAALVSVFLVSKKEESLHLSKSYLFFPIYIFLASALIEILLSYTDKFYLAAGELNAFNIVLFAIAFFIGLAILVFALIGKKTNLSVKDLIAGICLGIPNYFSIYFMMRALAVENWGASFVYPILNVSIISLAAFLSYLIYSEKISKLNFTGIALAILSIVLIAIGS